MSRSVGRMHLGNDHANHKARSCTSIRSQRGKGRGSEVEVHLCRSDVGGYKTRSGKGPVSMETVDKRVRLDVDAGKAVKESMNSNPRG